MNTSLAQLQHWLFALQRGDNFAGCGGRSFKLTINPIVGVYIPIIRISCYKGGMTIPNIRCLDPGTRGKTTDLHLMKQFWMQFPSPKHKHSPKKPRYLNWRYSPLKAPHPPKKGLIAYSSTWKCWWNNQRINSTSSKCKSLHTSSKLWKYSGYVMENSPGSTSFQGSIFICIFLVDFNWGQHLALHLIFQKSEDNSVLRTACDLNVNKGLEIPTKQNNMIPIDIYTYL